MDIQLKHIFNAGGESNLNLTDSTVTCELDLSLEYDKPFSFMDSSCTIELIKDLPDMLHGWEGLYTGLESKITELVSRTEIYIPGYFWGTVDYASSIIDEVQETITLKCTGMIKYLMEQIAKDGNDLPLISTLGIGETEPVSLKDKFFPLVFKDYITNLVVVEKYSPNQLITSSLPTNISSITSTSNGTCLSPTAFFWLGGTPATAWAINLKNFFDDVQKYYAAYAYFDGDKNFIFCNRTQWLRDILGAIDDKIMEDTFETFYSQPGYDSVLWNTHQWNRGFVELFTHSLNSSGFDQELYLVSGNPESYIYRPVQGKDKGFDPLDIRVTNIREGLEIATAGTAIGTYPYPFPFYFQYSVVENLRESLGDILLHLRRIRFSYSDTNMKLLDRFTIDGVAYKSVNVRINFLEETSEIEAVKV